MSGALQKAHGQGALVFNPDNGHYYGPVYGSYSWPNARDLAAGMTYLNFQGHLATITSPGEQNFVTRSVYRAYFQESLGEATSDWVWLGGYQPSGSQEPADGWSWVTGESFDFSNWGVGQPSDSGGNPNGVHQDFLMMWYHGFWNDASGPGFGGADLSGFIVEYEPVPEPGGLVLATLGLLLFGLRHRHKS